MSADDFGRPDPMKYKLSEMMAVVAARELRDGEVVFVGIGLPNLACNLARVTHAPNITLIYESGAVGAEPQRLPVSIGDPALVTGSLMIATMPEIFQYFLQGQKIDVGFLGGAQIDRWGNVNTTVIGDYTRPKIRLPGSGGALEIAVHAKRTLLMSRLSKRAFPETVDFVTSPGHRYKGKSRKSLGMPGAGPEKVITDKGILEIDPEKGEWVLSSLYPGVGINEVQEGVGWQLKVKNTLETTAPPTAEELRLLREELDPDNLFLKD